MLTVLHKYSQNLAPQHIETTLKQRGEWRRWKSTAPPLTLHLFALLHRVTPKNLLWFVITAECRASLRFAALNGAQVIP